MVFPVEPSTSPVTAWEMVLRAVPTPEMSLPVPNESSAPTNLDPLEDKVLELLTADVAITGEGASNLLGALTGDGMAT